MPVMAAWNRARFAGGAAEKAKATSVSGKVLGERSCSLNPGLEEFSDDFHGGLAAFLHLFDRRQTVKDPV